MHRSLFHFSKRSRDQLKAHVLMYHHRLPSPDPSLVPSVLVEMQTVDSLGTLTDWLARKDLCHSLAGE